MRNLSKVTITDAIINILEEDEKRKVISERTVPLKTNPNLSIYFEDLITKASEDGAARAAVFSIPDDDKPPPTGSKKSLLPDPDKNLANISLERCMTMFKSSAKFTAGSKEFSEKFYAIMEDDHRIGDGDLVACRFTAESDSGKEFLAIMKLLPVGAYRNVQRGQAGSGEMYVDLDLDPFVFPKNINVLQKVAVISKPPSEDRASEVLILDKQYKRGEIAQFFKNFLDVALVRDPAELTLNLYQCLIRGLNGIREILTPNLDRLLGDMIYEIFTAKGIKKLTKKGYLDLYNWVGGLKVNQKVKDYFVDELKNEFGRTKKIKLELSLVEKYIKRRSFNAQDDSKFSAETSSYNDLVQSVKHVTNKPGVRPYYEVVIHTSTWREDVN